ncbi:NAD(P)H-binding protein [Rarobacter faecitabidus]|nr:3-beta hydroxysteroid dehydrogenase [Rarobacter faecitabidus]
MRIAVAGGTGTVGRYVVAAARARDLDVTVLSRSTGVDIKTGVGLDRALDGVRSVIDVTNVTTLSSRASRDFFTTVTRHLLRVGAKAGVRHHVALSIVGIDDIDASYYAGKLAQERAVIAGEVPYTIARTAQFHEFVGQMLERMRGPVAMLPEMPIRPVSAREVGEHLVTLAQGRAQGRATDLVGPVDELLADLARRQLAHDGVRRRVLEVRLPGAYGRGIASGALRGGEARDESSVTFDEWLHGEDHFRQLSGGDGPPRRM